MIERDEYAEAKALPKGSFRALLAMSSKPTLPGRDTFNANAAFNLTWKLKSYGGIAKYTVIDGRAAYYLTPLGERIQAQAKVIGKDRGL